MLLVKDAITRHAHVMQTLNQAKIIILMHCTDTSVQYGRLQHLYSFREGCCRYVMHTVMHVQMIGGGA